MQINLGRTAPAGALWLSLNCRSGASFPAPVPPPSYAYPTASQCTVEVYAG
ncbi:hypothetical protein BT67DRAFT_440883, partial [Trichocladium antarcticum]